MQYYKLNVFGRPEIMEVPLAEIWIEQNKLFVSIDNWWIKIVSSTFYCFLFQFVTTNSVLPSWKVHINHRQKKTWNLVLKESNMKCDMFRLCRDKENHLWWYKLGRSHALVSWNMPIKTGFFLGHIKIVA